MKCKHCHNPLHMSQWAQDKALKSCPRCSLLDDAQHVFHSYPGAFGVSDKRANHIHPDGPQSYCIAHRKDKDGATDKGILCSDVRE